MSHDSGRLLAAPDDDFISDEVDVVKEPVWSVLLLRKNSLFGLVRSSTWQPGRRYSSLVPCSSVGDFRASAYLNLKCVKS